MRLILVLLGFFCSFSFWGFTGDTTVVSVNGYVEFYAASQSESVNSRPEFLYNYTSNGAAVNLALLKCRIQRGPWQLSITPMAGTYTQRNMASEPNAVRHLQEANFGLELNSGNKMRVDVGILPSHIGLESNVGSQNATLTRSLLAENTPYYACGLRWSGHLDSGIDWAVLVLNGWQRIQPLNKEEWPSFGFQLQYVLPKNGLLNYSTFLGRQGSSLVHYQNGYASWSLTNRLRCSVEANLGSGASSHWFAGASMVASYNVKEDWSIALRAEQCSDPGAWFFPMHNGKAIQPGGWSLNTDWRFADKITLRAEARRLWSASGHSIYQGESISSLWLWTAAGCISF